MKLELKFEVCNDFNKKHPHHMTAGYEMSRMLYELADKLNKNPKMDFPFELSLRDMNDNNVGWYRISKGRR